MAAMIINEIICNDRVEKDRKEVGRWRGGSKISGSSVSAKGFLRRDGNALVLNGVLLGENSGV
jgi:hypothetical protein